MKILKRIAKFLLVFVMVPSILVTAFVSLDRHGFFNIDNIDLVVTNFVDQPQYLRPLMKNLTTQLEIHRGTSLWRVDLADLRTQIEKLPWVEEVSLSRRWPAQLKVDLRVKEIYLLLMTKNGQIKPVVKTGELLPAVEIKEVPDVAVLQGDVFEKQISLRERAVAVLREIPKQGSFSQKTISEIHYDDKDGFWMTLIHDGVRVKMGQDQIAQKSARVSQVLEYMDSRQMDARVIDANLSKKVLVRLRKDP